MEPIMTVQITVVFGRPKTVALLDQDMYRYALWMPSNCELGTLLQIMVYSLLGTY